MAKDKQAETITVIVEENGALHLDFAGFVGQACLSEGDDLRQLLTQVGITMHMPRLTPKPELEQVPLHQRGQTHRPVRQQQSLRKDNKP